MKKQLLKSITSVALALMSFSIATKAQNSINFSGTSGNEAAANYSFDINNGFTVEYEMYLDNIVNYNAGVTSTNTYLPSPLDTYVDQSGNMSVLLGNPGAWGSVSIPNFVSGQWYNIAISYNANTDSAFVYINGVLEGTMNGISLGNQGTILIGNRDDGATYANAGFDRVLIWSGGARSAAQVNADQYTCFTGSETNLDVYYTMSEGSGTTLNNTGGAGPAANATITGPVSWIGGSDSCDITVTAIDRYYSPSGKHVWTTNGYHLDTMACGTIVYVNLTLTHRMYVNLNATGTPDGMSWASAYTNFADAVDSSMAGDTILVAQGTYQPASGLSFTMKDGVKIYGGFVGTESGLSQRNLPGGYATVLKGNGAAVIDNTSNNLTNAAVLDGFTITSGTRGMDNVSSSPILSNLVFTNNNNSTYGSGMANGTSSAPILTNVLFYGNTSDDGGGMFNNSSSPILTNVVFSNNTASSSGGAISNTHSSSTITNVTFSNNNAGTGGAIYNDSPIATTITNAIFWGNTDGSGFPDYASHVGAPAVITYCYTQTSIAGTGNIIGASDPFVNDASTGAVKGADSTWMTADDGLHLVTGSTAIGAGKVSAVPVGITTDITGKTAIIQSGLVNMGAYANTCQTESFISANGCVSYNSPSGNYTWTVSGNYIDTIPNHATCDSVIHINLNIIGPVSYVDTFATVCGQLKWYGRTYTESGRSYDTIKSKLLGCDSIINNLFLFVNPHTESAINIGTYASSYMFKGTSETVSGHYTFDTTSAAGCDSTVNLYLTFYAAPTVTTSSSCIPANLTLSASPLPVLVQWQKNNITVAVDTAKWDTGTIVAQDRLDNVFAITRDSAGNIYVSNTNEVIKYPKGATSATPGVTVAQNGISGIEDIKVDIAGNLFVEDQYLNKVLEYPVGSDSTTAPITVASGFRYPDFLFVDNADNVYVSDDNDDVVRYYPAGDSNGVVVAQTGLSGAGGIYVDNSGNLFVSDYDQNEVLEYPKGSNSSTDGSVVAQDGLSNADGLVAIWVDGNGYLYVDAPFRNGGASDSSFMYVYPPGSTATTHPIDSIYLPGIVGGYYFTTDASGNFYATSNSNGYVKKFSNIIKLTDSVKTAGSYNAMVNSFSGYGTTTNAIFMGAPSSSNTTTTACDFYVSPSGHHTWSTNGTFMDTIKNKVGCDSLMTINLTINHSTAGDTTATACDKLTWYGTQYTNTGTPTYTVKNKVGCDSVITLHLTINTSPTINITGRDSIPAGGKDTLVASGATTYSWTGGGTKDTLIVTPGGNTTYTVMGTSNGCTSTVTFIVKIEILTGMQVITNGGDVNLYPNPANTYVTLSFSNKVSTNATLSIVTEAGQVLSTNSISISNGKTMPIDITNLAEGIYFVRINTAGQTQVVRFVRSK